MDLQVLPVLFAFSLSAYGFISFWQSRRRSVNYPLPPGPTPIPIIGNVLGIDLTEPWVTSSTRLLNQEVIINSKEVAKDLLERRSYNYSDRPVIVRMMNDFFGWSFNSVMVPYGDRWHLHRRLLHQAFRHEAAQNYHAIQLQKARDLVFSLLETPENYYAHVQTHSTSVIMSIVYGYETAHREDPIISVVDRAVNVAAACIRPEVAAFLGFFPSLRYIPTWFPGASFKRTALLSQKYADDVIETPFRFVQENLAAGTAMPSMVSNSLNGIKGRHTAEYVLAIRESSVTASAAASETTCSTLLIFILAMLLNPDVQARAQTEIDLVVETERLAVFGDRPSLPYIEAVLRETLRWHPAVPLGVPHATTSADVYGGYFIPQGVTVVMNIWSMIRNEARYPNPEQFEPERFLSADGDLNNDTICYAFGAGRRICVGRHVADASLLSAIVSIFAVFSITPCGDEHGNDIPVHPQWTTGITSHPLRLPCQFVPRAPDDVTAEKLAQIL